MDDASLGIESEPRKERRLWAIPFLWVAIGMGFLGLRDLSARGELPGPPLHWAHLLMIGMLVVEALLMLWVTLPSAFGAESPAAHAIVESTRWAISAVML